MKVQISNDEIYEIKIPEEINPNDFSQLMSKFDNVAKIIRINMLAGKTITRFNNEFNERFKQQKENITKFKRKPHKIGIGIGYASIFTNTREKALDIIQYFYNGTMQDKIRISKIMSQSPLQISKKISGLRKRYNINDNEVGVTGRLGTKLIRNPDYVIKSYSGMFDEKSEENTNGNN